MSGTPKLAPPTTCRVFIAASRPEVRQALRELIELSPLPAVVLVEGIPGPAALAKGARGVLPRQTSADRLLAAVLAVRAGLTVLDVELADESIPTSSKLRAEVTPPSEPLTSREREGLRLLAKGPSNKEIGASLGISPHTAKFHVNGILDKLDAATRTDAVVKAAQHGWLML